MAKDWIQGFELAAIDKCQPIEYGVNQYIPAPLNTRVPESLTSNDLLFTERTFTNVNDKNSRRIPTTEAHNLFIRFQRLNEFDYYSAYLKIHYDYKDKLALQTQKDPINVALGANANVLDEPVEHNREKDKSFMNIMKNA